jgi:alpha-beta hydrolase superfamily lysophospholipase
VGAEPALAALGAFFAQRDDDPAVAVGMRSFLLPGRGAGVALLLHGLTASPPAWRAIAATLHARGWTVAGLRLPLHGHADPMTTALLELDTDALAVDLEETLTRAAALGEPLTVVGHSLGASLALAVAARSPLVRRVVAIAPFLGFVLVPHEANHFILPLLTRFGGRFLWWDPFARERLMPAHGYPRYPLRALAVALELADRARGTSEPQPPAAAIELVLNRGETSINNRAARRLAAGWQRAGGSVTVHYLRGLGWSHDIIEPARRAARKAHDTLVAIITLP